MMHIVSVVEILFWLPIDICTGKFRMNHKTEDPKTQSPLVL